jgi:hypothetical protein
MSSSIHRRDFIKAGSAAALAVAGAGAQTTSPAAARGRPGGRIWGNLLHLSYNMWLDWVPPGNQRNGVYQPYLRFDRKLWEDLTGRMADSGMNMVVIDLGDGVRYRSHPEIAVENAWSPDALVKELARLRKLGLEPIPKLNFSATHDAWLGKYARMVSTEPYYAVCRDLIREVVELFDKPRFFHLGMDEETAAHQKEFLYTVVRQFDLWWRDFLALVDHVEKAGSRPWIWSDYVWDHEEEFFKRMPKSVLQSNWYYGVDFGPKVRAAEAYKELADQGFDQVPTGSNWSSPKNFQMTVDFCTKHVSGDHLLGFLQTPWHPTLERCRAVHEAAIDQVAAVIKALR